MDRTRRGRVTVRVSCSRPSRLCGPRRRRCRQWRVRRVYDVTVTGLGLGEVSRRCRSRQSRKSGRTRARTGWSPGGERAGANTPRVARGGRQGRDCAPGSTSTPRRGARSPARALRSGGAAAVGRRGLCPGGAAGCCCCRAERRTRGAEAKSASLASDDVRRRPRCDAGVGVRDEAEEERRKTKQCERGPRERAAVLQLEPRRNQQQEERRKQQQQ